MLGGKDIHLEEEGYVLNNLILKDFFHAESLCFFVILHIVPKHYLQWLTKLVPGGEKWVKKYEQRENKSHFFHHWVPELFSFGIREKEEVWWLKMWFMLRVHYLKGEKINFYASESCNFFGVFFKSQFYLIGKFISLVRTSMKFISWGQWKLIVSSSFFLGQYKVHQRLTEIKSLILGQMI